MAQANRIIRGSSLLQGDNTIPGLRLPEELEGLIPNIIEHCREFGLDFYPIVVQMLTYDEISEVASYDGFPVRYPHWKWGMEYQELQQGYQHGHHRIFEIVINTNPCYIYCLDSNCLVDNVTVIAHAIGHNDFFKNNIFFKPTTHNMMNQLANHGTRIRRYISRWGKERVTEFIDHCLRIETLIDPAKAWDKKEIKDVVIRDERTYRQPRRISVRGDHDYMEDYINPPEWKQEEFSRIREREAAEQIDLFKEPTKDIMVYLRDYAPLKPWQADIISMMYTEALYFVPQRMTKMANEGWASYVDFNMIAKQGLASLGQSGNDQGIIEYALHKMSVLGSKYSLNPYKLGFSLFQEIEERWDKGCFGEEYEECKDIKVKEDWDQKLGFGRGKVLEVRKHYNDLMIIAEFFTADFCNKYEFFDWKRYPNGEYRIESRDPVVIKKKLMSKYINGGLPDIRLVDPNHRGRGYMFLEHNWDGRIIHKPYVIATLQSLYALWGNHVYLATKTRDEKDIIYCCYGKQESDVVLMSQQQYEEEEELGV